MSSISNRYHKSWICHQSPFCVSGFRPGTGSDMDGGKLAVCVRLGQRHLHAPHIRGPDLHGQQVTPRAHTWCGDHLTFRPAFDLRGPLTGWSMFLAMFSIMGAARTLPEFMHTLYTHGFYHSLCIPSFIENDRVSGFWTWMFVLSKVFLTAVIKNSFLVIKVWPPAQVPELGDTIFIVLRKQKLIFLHWYHHITVLIYCWYSFSQYTAPARWFVVMNFVVHSIMYTYYAFRALRCVMSCMSLIVIITTLSGIGSRR